MVGPVAEAEALYVRQLELPRRVAECGSEFVVWDIGLGAAANPITFLRSLINPAKVRIESFDHTAEPLAFALKQNQLTYLQGFEEPLATLIREGAVEFKTDAQASTRWGLHLADFPQFLNSPAMDLLPKPHAIFYDAYSPAKNPAMWTLPVFRKLREKLDPRRPCLMPTYSRSTILRVTLLLAGFFVGVGHATGEKEETTIAANSMGLIAEPLDRKWLFRARKSTSAEPLHTPVYRQSPLSEETWEQLNRHPQFV